MLGLSLMPPADECLQYFALCCFQHTLHVSWIYSNNDTVYSTQCMGNELEVLVVETVKWKRNFGWCDAQQKNLISSRPILCTKDDTIYKI